MTSQSPKKKVGTTVPFDSSLSLLMTLQGQGLRMGGWATRAGEPAGSLSPTPPPPPSHTPGRPSADSATEYIPRTVQARPLFLVAYETKQKEKTYWE